MKVAFSKRYILLLLISITSTIAYSQYTAIGFDVPGALFSRFHPSIEHSLNKNFTIGLNYDRGIYAEGTTGDFSSQTKIYEVNGWSIMPEVRYYPFTQKKIAPRGFSMGLYYRYGSYRETYTGEDYTQASQAFQNPGNQPPNANVITDGSTSVFGISLGYKLNFGPFILEPLVGFGTVAGEWSTPNDRNKIDPFFKDDLSSFGYSGRIELKLGFHFPQMKDKIQIIEDIPSSELESNTLLNMKLGKTEEHEDTNRIFIYIYRPNKLKGLAIHYELDINDTTVAYIKNNTFKRVELKEAGEYQISAKTESINAIKANFEAGKSYYLRCTVKFGVIVGLPKFEFVDAQIAENEILKIIERQENKK